MNGCEACDAAVAVAIVDAGKSQTETAGRQAADLVGRMPNLLGDSAMRQNEVELDLKRWSRLRYQQ